MENSNDSDKLYNLSSKDRPLNEDDVRVIVAQQLRNIIQPTVLASGFLQSGNYIAGTSGWKLSPTGAEFQSVTIAGVVVTTQGTFGGDGSDGTLSITSGTTTVDLGSAQVVVKNYSSISITGTGKLAFSNPHANGSTVILKCQGDVTLTSSSTSVIDTVGIGAIGGTGGAVGASGTDGTTALGMWSPTFDNGSKGDINAGSPSGGAGGTSPTVAEVDPWTTGSGNGYKMHRRAIFLSPGSGGGGGSGAANDASTQTGAGADGGRGGGALYIECGGAWNFTTGSIDVSGQVGGTAATVTASGSNSSSAGGGGGGGGAGMCLVLYNTLTANTGTIIAKGGVGGVGGATTGTGGNNGDPHSGAGGGGAAGYGGAGGAGASMVHPTNANSNGTAGSNVTDIGAGGGGGSGAACDTNGSHAATGGAGGTVGSSVTSLLIQNSFFG